MDDVITPLYYVLGRKIQDVARAFQILSITPCPMAVITRYDDLDLARQFSDTVTKDADPATVAKETQRPCVVITDGDALEAVYEDRRVRLA